MKSCGKHLFLSERRQHTVRSSAAAVVKDLIRRCSEAAYIEGKVVVITGASSGMGEASTIILAERGAKVVLGARGLDRLEGG